MANVLKREKQEQVLSCLVEGMSVRSAERITGVHRDTIIRLMKRVGDGCDALMDREMRALPCARIQVDEVWGFIQKKQRHVRHDENPYDVGDVWTWVAIDPDTKVVPTFWVGKRDSDSARAFIGDLAPRLAGRVQVSADALHAYIGAIVESFGANVDFGQLVKSYEAEPVGPGRYSPPHVVSAERRPVMGDPDPNHICTSHVERQNLTMRMGMRRLTRLTNGFSKKLENHCAATALHFGYYNYVRTHRTIKTTPAVAAGVAGRPWSIGDLLDRTSN